MKRMHTDGTETDMLYLKRAASTLVKWKVVQRNDYYTIFTEGGQLRAYHNKACRESAGSMVSRIIVSWGKGAK